MNANELKAICRWLVTIYLAASLAQATVPLLNDQTVDTQPCISTTEPVEDPQRGHGN